MPILALRGMTVLPGMLIHLDVNRDMTKRAIEAAMEADGMIYIVTQIDEAVETPTFEDLCEEAEKMFENQYPNIVFTALDERIVECVSEIDDNKYNVILIEQFRILESKNTEYKGMSKELYKYCAQYLYDIAKQKGYIIIVGININNNEKWLNNWLVKI